MRCLVMLIVICSLSSIASAQLEWEKRELEFHPAAGDKKVLAEFPFRNTGNVPVTINTAEGGCDCTVATLEKKTYQPGEAGKIAATFQIGQREGLQDKAIIVKASGNKESTILLRMKIFLPQILQFDRRFLFWKTGDASPQTIVVKVVQKAPVKITKVEFSGEGFTAELKTVQEGREYRVEARPIATDKPAFAALEVSTDLPAEVHRRWRVFMRLGNPSSPTTQPATQAQRR